VDPYGGFEPQVGQIRAVRTFRIGRDGALHPLFSSDPWADGDNTARCLREDDGAHRSPDPDCTCGFYAYGAEQWVAEHPGSRHVLAVVSCWGRIVAGTRGLRAEHSRVEALWLSAAVPAALAARVAARYPSVAVHRDRAAMLAEHPPTALDCYEQPPRRRVRPAGGRWWSAAVAAAAVGMLPAAWLGGTGLAVPLWIVLGVAFAVGALPLLRRGADGGTSGRGLLCLATSAWLFASLLGPFGLVLVRLPLLQVATVLGLQHVCVLLEARRIPARIS
jgi:hypothetical protein